MVEIRYSQAFVEGSRYNDANLKSFSISKVLWLQGKRDMAHLEPLVDGQERPDRRDAISIFCFWLLFVLLPTGTLLQVHYCLGLWKPIAPIVPPLGLIEAKTFSQRAYENALSESAPAYTTSCRETQCISRNPLEEQGLLPDFSSACSMHKLTCSWELVMAWVGPWTTNLRAIDSDTKKTHLCQAQGTRLLRLPRTNHAFASKSTYTRSTNSEDGASRVRAVNMLGKRLSRYGLSWILSLTH
ncbi:hypothetical protein KCU61_g331, partial [Aureobasidium melanogenum]